MKTIIFLCGLYSIAFAIFHILFWRLFNWKKELEKLNFANRGILQILNTRIIYFFLFVAYICFVYPDELLSSNLGKTFLTGISLFWLGRTIEQFVFFKEKNRYVHILTAIFVIGTILFALPLMQMFQNL
jgi:hypothetical protein